MSIYITKVAAVMNLKRQDARKPLDIHITPGDCRAAKKKDAHNCALALACKRQDKRVKAAYFFKSVAWVQYGSHIVRYLLPPSVQKEIVSFDRARMFAPGDYHLSPPGKTQKLSASCARKTKSVRRATKTRQGANKTRRHTTAMVRELQE